MGLIGLLQLKATDAIGYLLALVAGYVAGALVSDVTWSIFVSILVSYHFLLVWLLATHTGKIGLSMPLWATALTHAGCMVLAITPATMIGRSGIVHLLFRYGVVSLALFERSWLFSQEPSARQPVEESAPAAGAPSVRPTPEDELAWMEYLKTRRPGMTKPGVTIRQEHQAWLLARQQQRIKALMRQQQTQQTQATEPVLSSESPAVTP
jgi:hypothetical protein